MSSQILPNLMAAVRLIAHDAARAVFGATLPAPLHRIVGQQVWEEYRFMPLAGRQDQRQQLATAVGSQVDLGTETTLAAA
jgi:hypothetical protein